MHPLPPQAYTKDTLVQAYAWLQSQSESIKEMATTPDILVSLFLKTRLQGDGALERPSIQNFKNELKNLAGMMGEFEVEEPPKPQTYHAPSPPPRPRAQPAPAPAAPISSMPAVATSSMDSEIRTDSMVAEIRGKLNLSSDQEALRVLISVGYHQIKSLFK